MPTKSSRLLQSVLDLIKYLSILDGKSGCIHAFFFLNMQLKLMVRVVPSIAKEEGIDSGSELKVCTDEIEMLTQKSRKILKQKICPS